MAIANNIWYSLKTEVFVDDIKLYGSPEYKISTLRLVKDLRNKGYVFNCKYARIGCGFIYVQCGAVTYTFHDSGQSFLLEKGDMLYVPDKTIYTVNYREDSTILCILNFEFEEGICPSCFKEPFLKKLSDIQVAFKSISGQNMYNPLFLMAKAYEILYIIEKNNRRIPKSYSKILPAINEINQFYFENKKLSYYSDLCYMSQSNFRKLFKEHTGKTFIEYRNLIRISHAARMIENGECTVSEAAYITGFNNMSFFYEVYKKYKGN